MRFLFGIFIGAALTLLVATITDAPTSPLLAKINDSWQQFIQNTGEVLFRHQSEAIESSLPVPDPIVLTAEPPQSEEPVIVADSLPVILPESLPVLLPATPMTPANVVPAQADTDSLVSSTPPPTDFWNEVDLTTEVDATVEHNTANVWVPFHSERSASGFARRLSEHFAYPFSVERQGPGAYQVTFDYQSQNERDALLLEIAGITGL